MRPADMQQLFRQTVELYGSQVAVRFSTTAITYARLDQWSDAIAVAILQHIGVPQNYPFIGIYSERSPYTIAMMLGVWKAGYAYVPINPKNNAERNSYIINDSHIKLVLSDVDDSQLGEKVWHETKGRMIWIKVTEQLLAHSCHFDSVKESSSYAYVIYTSGTTGQPKGTLISQNALVNMVRAYQRLIEPKENHYALTLANIAFDASVWDIFPAIVSGCTVYFTSEAERANPDKIVDILASEKITTISLTPTYLSLLPYRKLPCLKYMMIGGESCPKVLIDRWRQTCQLINVYGPTENTVTSTACVFQADSQPNDIGLPLDGVCCEVFDDGFNEVPDGTIGQLYIGGAQLAEGYLNQPQLTDQKFITHPTMPNQRLFATGDLVSRQPNGHFLFYGRMDNQVKLHGIRVELEEVKMAIECCKGVEASAVEVVDKDGRNSLRAFVVLEKEYYQGKSDAHGIDEMLRLKDLLKKKLPAYMVPARLIQVDVIPQTINGKIDFNALHQYVSQHASHSSGSSMLTSVERQIATIWHELLDGYEELTPKSHFLELGGDSITLIKLLQRVNTTFNIQLNITAIYEHLQLSALARLVTDAKTSTASSGQTATPLENHEQSSFQHISLSQHLKNLYVHCLLNEQASQAYNLVELLPFGNTVEKERLLNVWNRLLASCDALRATFHRDDNNDEAYMNVSAFTPLSSIPVERIDNEDDMNRLVIGLLARPYDLSKGPLYHIVLYRLADGRNFLALFMHHLITDGWSISILREELYQGYHSSQIHLHNSFARYVDEQSRQETLGNKENVHSDYWNRYLKDSSNLRLSGFVSDNTDDDMTAGSVIRELPLSTVSKIYQYCAAEHLTPFALMASAFMLMLYRVSRQQRFHIAYPQAGRTDENHIDVVGYLVRPSLLVFSDESMPLSFADYCRKTMDDVRTAEQHPYNAYKMPLVSFTMETAITANRMGVVPLYTMAPLTLTIDTEPESMQCRWIFRMNCAETRAIERLHCYYEALLGHIVSKDAEKVCQLSILSEEERQNQLLRNSIFPIAKPQETIIDVFCRQVASSPGKIALEDTSGIMTYQEADELSDRMASAILQKHTETLAVGLFLPRSNISIVTMLAILKAGKYYVPLNDTYPSERLQIIAKDCRMQLLLTTQRKKAELEKNLPWLQVVTVDELLCELNLDVDAASSEVVSNKPYADSTTYLIYTSGTTGEPKGVPISHANVVSMVTIGEHGIYRPSAEDRVLQFNTYLFDASVIEIYSALLSGATLVTLPDELKQEPDSLFMEMERRRLSWAAMPAAYLNAYKGNWPKTLTTILAGGESPSAALIEQMKDKKFINSYGPTENTVASTYYIYNKEKDENISNCIGNALKGISCYVLDEHHNLLPEGVEGELFLGGLQLSKGYLDRPQVNEQSFIPNPFVCQQDKQAGMNTYLYATGDMVRMVDGKLFFMGRKDRQVKISGYRIELADIEMILMQCPSVNQCVVELRRNTQSQQLVAHVETTDPSYTPTQLRQYLLQRLPAYMVPAYWNLTTHFELTSNGKIDHSKLAEPVLYCAYHRQDGINEPTEMERRCRQIVARIIEMEPETIDVDAEFVEQLAMTSLHVLELSSLLSSRGYRITPTDIYRLKTIRQLAVYCSDSSSMEVSDEEVIARNLFFATPNNPNKPLMLVVSGYPYYEAYYTDFHRVFQNDYTLLVIESSSEFYMLRPDFPMNMDALIKEYTKMLKPVIAQRQLDAITGLCIGGDMALRLAVEMERQQMGSPIVFNIDGTANRSDYGMYLGFENQRGITPQLNEKRNHIMHTLSSTFHQQYYDGEVYLFMATQFRNENASTREEAMAQYPRNRKAWQQIQPNMPIIDIDDVHEELIHRPETLQKIKHEIDKKLIK